MLLVSSFVVSAASAQPSDEAQHQAASLFDRGVQEFAEQRYEAAAGSFLAADDLRGSREALDNALAAAQRAARDLLIARAASRLLARPDVDLRSRAAAQAALDRALPQLARIELRCAAEPCRAQLDGESARSGLLYAAPGAHELRAESAAGTAVVHVDCAAGAVCPVELRPAEVSPVPAAVPVADALPLERPAPESAPPNARAADSTPPARTAAAAQTQLPLGVFIAATTGALAFAALTTWSGVKAVRARRLYESDPAAYDDDEVRKHARRADAFFASSLLCAGGALLTGLLWVDFGARKRAKLTLAPWLRGGVLAEGRF